MAAGKQTAWTLTDGWMDTIADLIYLKIRRKNGQSYAYGW